MLRRRIAAVTRHPAALMLLAMPAKEELPHLMKLPSLRKPKAICSRPLSTMQDRATPGYPLKDASTAVMTTVMGPVGPDTWTAGKAVKSDKGHCCC